MKKNLHSPYFNENVGLKYLEQIKIIDYAFKINCYDATLAIKTFKPDFYCKGKEYKDSDSLGNLEKEKKVLKSVGGKIKFLGNNIQSSSKLISEELFAIKDDTIRSNLSKINFNEIESLFKKLEKLKVLIVGETIIDKYLFVSTKGISPKSNTLSCTVGEEHTMPGGALASYNFLSSFIKDVKLISIINNDLIGEKN